MPLKYKTLKLLGRRKKKKLNKANNRKEKAQGT